MENFNIENKPMVRVTWLDARDTETGWIAIKDIIAAPLAKCQEVGWLVVNTDHKIVVMRWVTKIEYLTVSYGVKNDI